LKTWSTDNLATFTTKEDACSGSSQSLIDEKTQCDGNQTTAENIFCTWKSGLMSACYTYQSCFASAKGNFENRTAQVKLSEEARKVEYSTAKKVICYVMVLNTTANKTEAFNACSTDSFTPTDLDITYPTPPTIDDCEVPADDNKDCSTLYTMFPDKAPLKPCTECTLPSPPGSGATGDWQLAMRFGTSSEFKWDSAYWTNDALLDENDLDSTKNADGKFAPFNDVKVVKIKGCLPNGCKEYTLNGTKTLKEIFTDTPESSTANIQFGETDAEINEWKTISGADPSIWNNQLGWMDTGINYVDDKTGMDGRVRFGCMFNNENHVGTTDSSLGFGGSGGSTSYRYAAGWARWGGSPNPNPTQGTIWVKGVAPPAPPPPVVTEYQLAMRFSDSSEFKWDSAYWKNDALLDENDLDSTKNADGKFAAFNTVCVTKIKGCLPNGCKEYTLNSTKTLKEIFTDTPESSTANIQFSETDAQINEWKTISGADPSIWNNQAGWMATGINYDDDKSGYDGRVRFGAMFNNEGTISSSDSSIGFGGSGNNPAYRYGAGYVQYGGTYKNSRQGTIWVQCGGAPAPPPPPPSSSTVGKFFRMLIPSHDGPNHSWCIQTMRYLDCSGNEIDMTGGTATASTTYYGVGDAFFSSHHFCSGLNPTYPQWSALEFSADVTVCGYKIQALTGYGTEWVPKSWTIASSDDGSTWTDLDTQTVTWTASGEWKTFTFGSSASLIHAFWQWLVSHIQPFPAMTGQSWKMSSCHLLFKVCMNLAFARVMALCFETSCDS